MVTWSSMTVSCPSYTWMTALSCTELLVPMRIAASSPRNTAPNQTLTPSASSTSPITLAVGVMNAPLPIFGVLPLNVRMQAIHRPPADRPPALPREAQPLAPVQPAAFRSRRDAALQRDPARAAGAVPDLLSR